MKRDVSTKKFFLFSIIFISLSLIAFESRGDESSKKDNAKKDKIDRLFDDMGITRIKGANEPVEFTLKDMNGKETKMSEFRGRIVFLNFWATWCPPCRGEMPAMEKLYQRFKDRDFAMIAIDLQEPASQVKDFFARYKLNFVSLLDSDGEVGRGFGIRSIPTTFFLDREGKVMAGAIGPRAWDSKKSFALFEALIEQ